MSKSKKLVTRSSYIEGSSAGND